MSDLGDHARDLHHRAMSWPAAPRAVGPLADAGRAMTARFADLQHLQVKTLQPALLALSPSELAQRVRDLAEMARVEEQPSTDVWSRIGALAHAGWVTAARSEELRVDTGDEAA